MEEENKRKPIPNYKEAKCCDTCKHSEYSTRSLSSWCKKYPELDGDGFHAYRICDDFEERK